MPHEQILLVHCGMVFLGLYAFSCIIRVHPFEISTLLVARKINDAFTQHDACVQDSI